MNKKIVVLLAILILAGATTVYGVDFISKNQAQNTQNCPYNGECVTDGICPNDQCPYKNSQSSV